MAVEEASILWCSASITRPQAEIQVSCGSRFRLWGKFTRALCSSVRLVFPPEADSLPGRECLFPLWAPAARALNRHIAGIGGAHTGS